MIPSYYGADEASGVWVYLERGEAHLAGVSLELLGSARGLADELKCELTGVLPGPAGMEALADEAFQRGADVVLVAEDERLARFSTEPYTRVVAEAVLARTPSVLLVGATPDGRDLAGRLAVRLRTGLTADCTGLRIEPETGILLLGETTGFGGGITATIKCPVHRPQMATVRPGVFPLPPAVAGRGGRIEYRPVSLQPQDLRVEVLERVVEPQVDLTQAKVVVAGGRGVGSDFGLLEDLARLLGGEVGATRVAVDEGWIGRERQIGQTGYVTRPDVAIVCGCSGAMQFTVGVKDAGTVVSINTDPEAPIFEDSDYCVVDDVKAVLPPLIQKIRERQAAPAGRG